MKNILLTLILLHAGFVAFSQNLVVENVSELTNDITARISRTVATNGERCAVVKLFAITPKIKVIQPTEPTTIISKTNEFWIFITPGINKLQIECEGEFSADRYIDIDFNQYGIPVLESKKTYMVVVNRLGNDKNYDSWKANDINFRRALELIVDPTVPTDSYGNVSFFNHKDFYETLSDLGWPTATDMLWSNSEDTQRNNEYWQLSTAQRNTFIKTAWSKYIGQSFKDVPAHLSCSLSLNDDELSMLNIKVEQYNKIARKFKIDEIRFQGNFIEGSFLKNERMKTQADRIWISKLGHNIGLVNGVYDCVYVILEMERLWYEIADICNQGSSCSGTDNKSTRDIFSEFFDFDYFDIIKKAKPENDNKD